MDPLDPRGAVNRAYAAFLRTPPGRYIAINVAARVDPTLMRVSRGHVGIGLTFPTLNLTTTGARSGQPRTATVVYFTDGDDVIAIASSFGRDKHPAWYHNLRAQPEARLEARGRGGRYRAEEVSDEAERERLWALANRVYPGYDDYEARVGPNGRRIPILRFSPLA